jgi:hypothetical protein
MRQVETRGDLHSLDGVVPIAVRLFLVATVAWALASLVLVIPHGPGHSIESMTPVVLVRDAASPVAIASFACMLAALVVRTWRRLGGS